MPTPTNWAAKAALTDDELVTYKGLTKARLQKLEAQGVDVAPFVAAQQANNALKPDSAASTRERTRATFASEKRKLLQAMSGYITQKVAKGLKAVKADNASALDRNRRQQEVLVQARSAIDAALDMQRQQAEDLQRQDRRLQELPHQVGDLAGTMHDLGVASLEDAARAFVKDDGELTSEVSDTEPPSPNEAQPPTQQPGDRNHGQPELEAQQPQQPEAQLPAPTPAPAPVCALSSSKASRPKRNQPGEDDLEDLPGGRTGMEAAAVEGEEAAGGAIVARCRAAAA